MSRSSSRHARRINLSVVNISKNLSLYLQPEGSVSRVREELAYTLSCCYTQIGCRRDCVALWSGPDKPDDQLCEFTPWIEVSISIKRFHWIVGTEPPAIGSIGSLLHFPHDEDYSE